MIQAGGAAAITCTTLDAQGVNELTYREGNVGRNASIGPGVFNWDSPALVRCERISLRSGSLSSPGRSTLSESGFVSAQPAEPRLIEISYASSRQLNDSTFSAAVALGGS